jgi:hypothetical protein
MGADAREFGMGFRLNEFAFLGVRSRFLFRKAAAIWAGRGGIGVLGFGVMKTKAMMLGGVLGALAFVGPVCGGSLPMLEQKPWEGYYVGYEGRTFHFGIDIDAGMRLMPVNKKGEAATHHVVTPVYFVIEEVVGEGKTKAHPIDTETLSSETGATAKPKGEILIKGKTNSGVGFVLSAEFDRGKAILGGKITDQGGLTNPLRVAVRANFPAVYRKEDAEDREFQKKVKRDNVSVKTLDGGREKFDANVPIEAGKVNGKGLSWVEVEFFGFYEKNFEFEVEGAGALEFDYKGEKKLYDGVPLFFRPDPAKDKDGAARVVIKFG